MQGKTWAVLLSGLVTSFVTPFNTSNFQQVRGLFLRLRDPAEFILDVYTRINTDPQGAPRNFARIKGTVRFLPPRLLHDRQFMTRFINEVRRIRTSAHVWCEINSQEVFEYDMETFSPALLINKELIQADSPLIRDFQIFLTVTEFYFPTSLNPHEYLPKLQLDRLKRYKEYSDRLEKGIPKCFREESGFPRELFAKYDALAKLILERDLDDSDDSGLGRDQLKKSTESCRQTYRQTLCEFVRSSVPAEPSPDETFGTSDTQPDQGRALISGIPVQGDQVLDQKEGPFGPGPEDIPSEISDSEYEFLVDLIVKNPEHAEIIFGQLTLSD